MTDIILFQPLVGKEWSVINSPRLPLGLLHAAKIVAGEYQIRLIDMAVENNWKEILKNEIDKKPICFALSCKTGSQIKYALEASSFVKQSSEIPIVWGGMHPTLLPEKTLVNKNIDILVQGDGEITFYELVKALVQKKSLKDILGISYKKNGGIIFNPPRPSVDLDGLPRIPYGLIDIKKYTMTMEGKGSIDICSSRGCQNKCGFCYNSANNSRWIGMRPEKFIEELESTLGLSNKIKHVRIIDDDFFCNIKRAKEIIRKIYKYNITWECFGLVSRSAARIDDDFLELISKSGCTGLTMGVESGSERILKIINKKNDLDFIIGFNKRLSKYNLRGVYSFVCGFYSETLRDLKKTIELAQLLIKDNKKSTISFQIYTPYPGTTLYDSAVKEGFVPPESLKDWIGHEMKGVDLPWIDENRRKVLKGVYFCSHFIDNKLNIHIKKKWIQLLASLYRPIARFRMTNLFFRVNLELVVAESYLKLI